MDAVARLRYLRVSPQKARLVADTIRGKRVEEALDLLRYNPKAVARDLRKLVESALANAKNAEAGVDVDRLVVADIHVDGGPSLKRIRYRAMGRVFRILKRTCHVTVQLEAR
jgi:large subunit ribosomal protein L22